MSHLNGSFRIHTFSDESTGGDEDNDSEVYADNEPNHAFNEFAIGEEDILDDTVLNVDGEAPPTEDKYAHKLCETLREKEKHISNGLTIPIYVKARRQTYKWRVTYDIMPMTELEEYSQVAASSSKVVDESMSTFKPQTTKMGNFPHLSSFIHCKPESLGLEIKATADSKKNATGCMICLVLQEGMDPMRKGVWEPWWYQSMHSPNGKANGA
jgi:hypothetical protein